MQVNNMPDKDQSLAMKVLYFEKFKGYTWCKIKHVSFNSMYIWWCIYSCKGFYLKFHCTPTVLQKNNIFKSPTPCWFYCCMSTRSTVCILLVVSLNNIKLKSYAKCQGKLWYSLSFLTKCQVNLLPPYTLSTAPDWKHTPFSQVWEALLRKKSPNNSLIPSP